MKHTCANCGCEFEGSFCPKCGQDASVGRVSWKSVWEEIKGRLGWDKESKVSTLARLLWRPGRLIGDYIDGRKKSCDSPLSVLFLVAAVVALIIQQAGIQIGGETAFSLGGFKVLERAVEWFMDNLGWAVLLMTAFYILPTWLLFRHSPKHSHHTVPEGIFIQLFMSSLVLIFISLGQGITPWFYLLVPIHYFVAYRQLFGYGFWGTLWRVILMFLISVLCELLLVWAVIAIFG